MPDVGTKQFAADALAEALREGEAGEGLLARSKPASPHDFQIELTSRSRTEQDGAKSPLHGSKPPTYEVQSEQPKHLVIAYMAASGMAQSEIATRQGLHPVTVSNLFRQPWFQQRVVDIITDQGQDVVRTLIAGAAVDSVLHLIHLRNHAKSEQVQAVSAIHLLDRHLGKAPQKVDHRDESGDPHKEEAQLRRQLAELERQERELQGAS